MARYMHTFGPLRFSSRWPPEECVLSLVYLLFDTLVPLYRDGIEFVGNPFCRPVYPARLFCQEHIWVQTRKNGDTAAALARIMQPLI